MAQRPQVRQFQAPTQADIRPAASPVETYVRPVVQDQAPSELSQFLSAITPAIKVEAEQRKLDRLKKEREIANGIQRNKEAQLTAKKDELLGNLYLDYVKDTDASHAKTKEQIIAERSEYTDNYIGQLRQSGVDENLITAFETEIMTGHSAFINDKWMVGKLDYEQTQQLNELAQPIFTMNALAEANEGVTLEQGKQRIHKYITDFKSVNPDISWDRINSFLIDKAFDDSKDRPNSPLIAWLSDADLSMNQLNNSKYADKAAAIRQRREDSLKLSKSEQTTLVKGQFYGSQSFNYFETGDTSGMAYDKDITMGDVSFRPDQTSMSQAIDTEWSTRSIGFEQEMQEIANSDLPDDQKVAKITAITTNKIEPLNRQYFDYYAATGQVPPRVGQGSLDFKLNVSKNVTDPEVKEKLEQSYKELDTFSKYGGSLKSVLGDKEDEFIAIQTLVDNNVLDLPEATAYIQGTELDPNKIVTVTEDTVRSSLDSIETYSLGFLTGSDKDNVDNLAIMLPEIQKVAGLIQQVKGGDESDIIAEAITKVAANYQAATMPSGKKFLLNMPANSKQAKAAVEDIEQGIASIMGDGDLVAAIHTQLGLEPRYVLDDAEGTIVGRSQLAQARREGKFPVRVYADQANFELTLTQTANPNEVYVTAVSKDGSETFNLTTINLNSYGKGKLNQLRESYITAAKGQITSEVTGADELEIGKPVDTVFDIDTSQEEDEVLAPVISVLEEQRRMYGAEADRRTAEAGVRDYMEKQRDEILGRARIAMQNQGVTPEVAEEASQGIFDTIFGGISDLFGGTAEAADVEQPSETSSADRTFSDRKADVGTIQGTDVQSKASNLIQVQEDFRANPYKDGKNKSVGYGFYLPSLEADEKALIADVNNITEPEAQAVMKLKVSKITNFMTDEIQGFGTLPEQSQIAVISMGFQLGRENVRDEWPKFMTSLREAAQLPTGSAQQKKALKEASNHMLFNMDGRRKTKTNWHKQTPNRANEMALALQGN